MDLFFAIIIVLHHIVSWSHLVTQSVGECTLFIYFLEYSEEWWMKFVNKVEVKKCEGLTPLSLHHSGRYKALTSWRRSVWPSQWGNMAAHSLSPSLNRLLFAVKVSPARPGCTTTIKRVSDITVSNVSPPHDEQRRVLEGVGRTLSTEPELPHMRDTEKTS